MTKHKYGLSWAGTSKLGPILDHVQGTNSPIFPILAMGNERK